MPTLVNASAKIKGKWVFYMNKSKLKTSIPEKIINMLVLVVIFILFSLLSCTKKQSQIEKKIETGIEVVYNHLEPYIIEGEPSTFRLEKDLIINQERADLIDKGMMTMGEFDIDQEGNIYIVGSRNLKNLIFKFDGKGNYVTSFAQKGQGPGELEMPFRPVVYGDNIAITDRAKKIVFFDSNGKFIKEKYFKRRVAMADILENGKYIFYGWLSEYRTYDYAWESLSLFDTEFQKLKDLDVYKSDYRDTRYPKFFMWRVTNSHIYIINEDRGYEILVYDLEGNIVRKIRKEYRPVPTTKEIKKLIMGPHYVETGRNSSYVPDPLPPIKFFFTDDEGRLFVMTYEEGDNPGEYLYDIFSPEGLFVGRKSLNLPWVGKYFGLKFELIKNNHLYCYKEKENGFKELVVYKIYWR